MQTQRPNLSVVHEYFAAVTAFASDADRYANLLHPEMRQREFPNQMNRTGQESDLADTLRRLKLGREVMSEQRYEITNVVEKGDTLVVEAVWTGTLARAAGTLEAGRELRANFCMIFEFRDGLIYRQRNYDCFAPF